MKIITNRIMLTATVPERWVTFCAQKLRDKFPKLRPIDIPDEEIYMDENGEVTIRVTVHGEEFVMVLLAHEYTLLN